MRKSRFQTRQIIVIIKSNTVLVYFFSATGTLSRTPTNYRIADLATDEVIIIARRYRQICLHALALHAKAEVKHSLFISSICGITHWIRSYTKEVWIFALMKVNSHL